MKLTRAQLAKFLPDNEAVRFIEELADTSDKAYASAGAVSSLTSTVSGLTGTPLSVAVSQGEMYKFEFFGAYTATAGTKWTIDGPAATVLAYSSEYGLSDTSTTINQLGAYNLPAAANASSASAGNVVKIEGILKPSASGTLSMSFSSAATVNLLGGYVRLIRLT